MVSWLKNKQQKKQVIDGCFLLDVNLIFIMISDGREFYDFVKHPNFCRWMEFAEKFILSILKA